MGGMTDPHHSRDDRELSEAGDVHALTRPCDEFKRKARLEKIVDGDTLRLIVELGFDIETVKDVRLAALNTPEHRGPELPAGKYVTQQVHKWFEDAGKHLTIHSTQYTTGKYGRCICYVWAQSCLNEWLLDARLAWPMNGLGSIEGARDIDRLTGIPVIIREAVKSRQG